MGILDCGVCGQRHVRTESAIPCLEKQRDEALSKLETANAEVAHWKAEHTRMHLFKALAEETCKQNEDLRAEIESTKLQVRELQDLLWEIGNKDVSEPFSRDDAMKILKLLNKTKYTEKRDGEKPRICEDCGKKDASVARACFKAGRGYLCHDCDR